MTNKKQLIAILTLATVLITGGFGLTPFAYSTNNDHDDKDNKWKLWKLSYDEHDDEEEDEHDEDPATIKIINKVAGESAFSITVSPNLGDMPPTVPLATTTYTVDSHTTVTISGPDDRPILITGDGNCPENNGGFVNIESGQNIECTYSNRLVVPPTGGEGIIFQHNSMQVQLSENSLLDSCDKTTDPAEKDPCIEIISAVNGIIGIVDSKLTSDTTIVLFSVIEANRLETTLGAENPVCSISAIVQHNKKSFYLLDNRFNPEDTPELAYPSNPTTHNVVVLKCTGMVSGTITDPVTGEMRNPIYNVNYAMIDPAV